MATLPHSELRERLAEDRAYLPELIVERRRLLETHVRELAELDRAISRCRTAISDAERELGETHLADPGSLRSGHRQEEEPC